ncbi:hypothetical protein [Agrobacterium vitis]|uniref:hypothetical protein n=1 Tax=Agrobacterium vitis TaxID=373 RepID=UPI0015718AD1|nr:hypothetical protein [Agrobacterium vitis]NSZ15334.1 hypothetical protein [Agrobacterium vitis]QZO04202.1 hypothetical protein K4831_01055 [Agrobacterium vitis]UJL89330.1 hypothetical protein AVF2S5_16275 [Agrobacterium vitis]
MEFDGGQGGYADRTQNQSANPSTLPTGTIENIEENGAIPNRIETAALWLSQRRHELGSNVIAVLKDRFSLGNLEAIDAAKRAHALAYGGRP